MIATPMHRASFMYVLYATPAMLCVVARGQYQRYYTCRACYGYAWALRQGPRTFMCVGRPAGIVQADVSRPCSEVLPLRTLIQISAASTVQCAVIAYTYLVQYVNIAIAMHVYVDPHIHVDCLMPCHLTSHTRLSRSH